PHVRSEVVVGEFKSLLNGLLAHGEKIPTWRVEAVVQRLSCTPKHQGSAQARREEHGKPHRYRVCRLFIIIAQAQISIPRYENRNQENEHERIAAYVHPAKIIQPPATDNAIYISRALAEGQSKRNEGHNKAARHEENKRISLQTQKALFSCFFLRLQ